MSKDLNQGTGREREAGKNPGNEAGRAGSSSQEQQVDNPQSGSEWSNYQTRELAGKEEPGRSAEEEAKAFGDE